MLRCHCCGSASVVVIGRWALNQALNKQHSDLEFRIFVTIFANFRKVRKDCEHLPKRPRQGTYGTHGDAAAPPTGRTPAVAEGATALSHSRFFFVGSFGMLLPSRCSLSCLSARLFLVPRGSDFIPGFEEPASALYHRHRAP